MIGRLELWRRRSPERRALIALGVSMSAAAGPAVLAAPASAQLSAGCSQSGSEVTCSYSSGSNEVAIPNGVRFVRVDAAGGMGSAGSQPGGGAGGVGDEVDGTLPVHGPTTLWAVVGGNGSTPPFGGGPGGANGGGNGGNLFGGSGGGASDVRTSESDLTTRLLVAAGGGGGGGFGTGGTNAQPVRLPGGNGGDAGMAGGPGTLFPSSPLPVGSGGEPGTNAAGGRRACCQ